MTAEEEHLKEVRSLLLLRTKKERPSDSRAELEFFRAAVLVLQRRPECMWCRCGDICIEAFLLAMLDVGGDQEQWLKQQTIACLGSCRECIEAYYNSRPILIQSLPAEKASIFQNKVDQFDRERLVDIFCKYAAASKEERKQPHFKYAIAEFLVYPGWFGVSDVNHAMEQVLEIILGKGKLNYSERPAGVFLATLHRSELIRKWAMNLIALQEAGTFETDLPNYSWKTVFSLYSELPVERRVECLGEFAKHVSKLKLKQMSAQDYEAFTELILAELATNTLRITEFLEAFACLFNVFKPAFDFKKLNSVAFQNVLLNPAFAVAHCPSSFSHPRFIESFLYACFVDNVSEYPQLQSILTQFLPQLVKFKFQSVDFQEYLVKTVTRYICDCLGNASIAFQVLTILLSADSVRFKRSIEIAFNSLVAHDFCKSGPVREVKGLLYHSNEDDQFVPEKYRKLLPELAGINVESAVLRALRIYFRQAKFDLQHLKERVDILTCNRPVQDPSFAILLYWLRLVDELTIADKSSVSAAVLWSLNVLIYTRFHGFKTDRIVTFLNDSGLPFGDCKSWFCQVTFPFFMRSKEFSFSEVSDLAYLVCQISLSHINGREDALYGNLQTDDENFDASAVLEPALAGLLEFVMRCRGGRTMVELATRLIIAAAHFKIDLATCKAGQILRVLSTSTLINEQYRDQLIEAVEVYANTAGGNSSFRLRVAKQESAATAASKDELDAEISRRLAYFEQLDREYMERHRDTLQQRPTDLRNGSTKPASKLSQLRQEMTRTVPVPASVKKRGGQIPSIVAAKAPKLMEQGSSGHSSSSEDESLPFSSELFKEPIKPVVSSTAAPQQRSIKLIDSQKDGDAPLLSGRPIQTKAQQRVALQRKMQRDWLSAHKLHRFILGLDYDTLKEEDTVALSGRLNIRQIPASFSSYDAYAEIFEPLLLMESHAQIVQAKEEAEGRATFYPCTVENIQIVDDFHEILFNFGDNATHRLFTEQDVIVGHQSRHHHHHHHVADGNILGVVTSTASRNSGFEVTVRFCLTGRRANLVLHLTRLKSHWKFAKLCNLVTSSREFLALHNLPLFKCVQWILTPKFSPLSSQAKEKVAALTHYCERNLALNPSQAQAIAFSLLNGSFFSLIQGPPGTGKTRTIEGFLATCLGANRTTCPIQLNVRKVLICAPSNAAIDEIVRRIKKGVYDANGRHTALKIVRVGAVDMIHEDVQDVCLDVLAETRAEQELAAELAKHDANRRHISELKEQLDSSLLDESARQKLKSSLFHSKEGLRRGTKAMEETRQRIRAQILREAQVVCCTLSASGHEIIGRIDREFDMVIIDEACQAVELSALIPLQYGCRRAILIGDPNQLPPTIISQAACSFAYEQSLFQRLQRVHPEAVQLLSVQYRMHPAISAFPSAYFYQGKLSNGPAVEAKNTRPWHALSGAALLGPYQFFDAPGRETFRTFSDGRQGKSMMNEVEAKMVIDLIERLALQNPTYNVSSSLAI